MDFESPDVEKEFPGLYASESARKSNESDFSDEGGHEKHSKKDLLGGKRKDKKDKKDRGYATLEGESSPDEDQETKSPSKYKKTKAFKFPTKKEKREKSREKDGKEKDSDKDKKKKDKDEKDGDKEKRKDKEKSKQKVKDRKKGKHGDECLDIGEQPIFGVSLHLAVERSRCHDGVELPLIVRDCIDFVEEHGMSVEGIYKVPGVKSKVQNLKKMYNQRDPVNIGDFEPTVAASLLTLFLRELPEPVLETSEIISRFEQAASTKEVAQRESQIAELTQQLPECNRVLLAWVILHLDHITMCEKTTKMNAQTIAMTLSPVLQMSHRLLLALLFHCKALFPNIQLSKYIPPLSAGSTCLPDMAESIAAELAKQESLLSQIHMQMNAGFVTKSREEQLWEVQRMITQLKRKYKTVQKLEGTIQKSIDEETKSNDEINAESKQLKPNSEDDTRQQKSQIQIQSETVSKLNNQSRNIDISKESRSGLIDSKASSVDKDTVDHVESGSISQVNVTQECSKSETNVQVPEPVVENPLDKLRESLIHEELLNMKTSLKTRLIQEKLEIERLLEMIADRESKEIKLRDKNHTPNDLDVAAIIQITSENQLLEKKMTTLIRSIVEEKDACVELRVQLALHQLMLKNNVNNIKQI
ncbi:ralA-binding protein 1 isoform X2 [Leptopilina boulardi]|uniref:ralA-binding protein 1 isoform X2 n=1 Tax=Leptopilina boulardi TaxID=63433 RepID=UPI0021F606FD|nr:ralA-binding protein 1 isoform X2 [Leptopilina boulardi]